jgi:hypothetical protein
MTPETQREIRTHAKRLARAYRASYPSLGTAIAALQFSAFDYARGWQGQVTYLQAAQTLKRWQRRWRTE